MVSLKCASCGTGMEQVTSADMTVERCPKCEAVFLNKGELNNLATGMSGDIEYCSIDGDFHEDRFPTRKCPKCPDNLMKKINLLRLSGVIFDYCPECESFFLDSGDVKKMNTELKALTANKDAEEYRVERDGHLVRIDQTSDVVQSEVVPGIPVAAPTPTACVRITVFYGTPIGTELRIFQESWPTRLLKAVGLFNGEDIETGNGKFDDIYRVQGTDDSMVRSALSARAIELLLKLAEKKMCVYSQPGTLEVSANSVTYTEGPYQPDGLKDTVDRAEPLTDHLVALATALTTRKEE